MEKLPKIISSLTKEEVDDSVLSQTPEAKDILAKQELLTVEYLDKHNQLSQGQILIDKGLVKEIKEFFEFALSIGFQFAKVIPIQDKRYDSNDILSMEDNNTSAMNYRLIAGTKRLSVHSFGRAIDINPWDNPVVKDGKTLVPVGAVRNITEPGVFTGADPVTQWFEERGWKWLGRMTDPYQDFHHFEKP